MPAFHPSHKAYFFLSDWCIGHLIPWCKGDWVWSEFTKRAEGILCSLVLYALQRKDFSQLPSQSAGIFCATQVAFLIVYERFFLTQQLALLKFSSVWFRPPFVWTWTWTSYKISKPEPCIQFGFEPSEPCNFLKSYFCAISKNQLFMQSCITNCIL